MCLLIFLLLFYLAIELISYLKRGNLPADEKETTMIAKVVSKRFRRETEGNQYYIRFRLKDGSVSEYSVSLSDYRRLEQEDYVRLHLLEGQLRKAELDESINGYE